jgi:hypothetical protein
MSARRQKILGKMGCHTSPSSIFQELCVDVFGWELYVSHDRTADEAVLHGHLQRGLNLKLDARDQAHHMWMPALIEDLY